MGIGVQTCGLARIGGATPALDCVTRLGALSCAACRAARAGRAGRAMTAVHCVQFQAASLRRRAGRAGVQARVLDDTEPVLQRLLLACECFPRQCGTARRFFLASLVALERAPGSPGVFGALEQPRQTKRSTSTAPYWAWSSSCSCSSSSSSSLSSTATSAYCTPCSWWR